MFVDGVVGAGAELLAGAFCFGWCSSPNSSRFPAENARSTGLVPICTSYGLNENEGGHTGVKLPEIPQLREHTLLDTP